MSAQTKQTIYTLSRYGIAVVWLINGLFCKVFNLVPRHQQIVERILNLTNGLVITKLIGIAEIVMFIWIISGVFKKLNALTQIAVIVTMNILEFHLAKDLLLWQEYNLLFALVFSCFIAYTAFILYKKPDCNVTLS
ncbi:hypothetical protein I5907_17305 [Panacibacter sp. DH6]|uniref:DoxX family protein n=1 Tax=Panacibacter microcysteis TaxID=2793269 RepID=A0A931GZ27_9BACT|nr:DoxX-like family protein [Panacibacter microcysteis]MBG9378000.1 hypothetical protein [Panacibacter microcysteis]